MGVGSQNTFLTYDPYPIAGLCCEFQLSKGKTVGGDALQRPKSASKIYLSMDLSMDFTTIRHLNNLKKEGGWKLGVEKVVS